MKMKISKRLESKLWLATLAIALFVLLPTAGKAACPAGCPTLNPTNVCPDGFTEQQKCAGITLWDNVTTFTDTKGGTDLFVILVPATSASAPAYNTIFTGSLIPANPTSTFANLGITTYELNAGASPAWNATNNPNRYVSSASTQKAARVTENLDITATSPFGNSIWGTPNGLDGATVWTQRVKNYVYNVACASATDANCRDSVSGATGKDNVVAAYLKNTVSHELGHVTGLTATSNSRYGGNHYVTGSNTVMEQSIVYTSKSGVVTFYIPNAYASGDATAARLK